MQSRGYVPEIHSVKDNIPSFAMSPTMRQVRILGSAGILHQGSYNREALRAASELAPKGMVIEIFDLLQIPLYNADIAAAAIPNR
jgi:hypothetical protein